MGSDLSVRCPRCETSGHVPLEFVGREIRCRKCGNHFPATVPSAVCFEDDDAGLAPLTPEDEKHCRERYEARVLSKDRNERYEKEHINDELAHETTASAVRKGL